MNSRVDMPSRGTPPTPTQVVASVAAAFFGVQSSRNRRRDFSSGNPLHFLAAGLVLTGVVALIFALAVRLTLHLAR